MRHLWHELALWMGLTNAGGPQYLWWSGIAGDAWLVIPLVYYRKHNCHTVGCWRLGKFPLEGTPYTLCRRHHPDVDKLHADDIPTGD